VQAMSLTKMLL